MLEGAASQRAKILAFLREHGGATGDGLDEALGWRPTSAGRRLPELRELGLVTMTEEVRVTRSGRRARIWRVLDG